MKLKRITVTAFEGIQHIDLALDRPIALIAGRNEAGKSSILDAIRFAFCAEPVRVALKKEFGALVRDGSKGAAIQIETDVFSAAVTISADGKIKDSLAGAETLAALPYVLDAQRFSGMSPDDRRSFLYGLMGVQITPAEISKRLLNRGCDATKVREKSPMFRVTG